MTTTGSLDKQWFNRYNINPSHTCIHSAIKLLVYIWESIAFIIKHICKWICCVRAPPLLFPWDMKRMMKIPNETPCSLRRGLFPWLLVRNAISFPNHHLLLSVGSTEDEKTYSAQVEPQKVASDREVLSSKPFNRARDFCSLHGTPAWNDRNPQ